MYNNIYQPFHGLGMRFSDRYVKMFYLYSCKHAICKVNIYVCVFHVEVFQTSMYNVLYMHRHKFRV